MGSQGIVGKTIQNLKEIVNCYDSEIYTMLVECNMDPNKAVISLISQEPFQEVKSKRNRNKNTKDQAESSNRGARNSAKESYNTARGGGNKFNSKETRVAQSVPANKRGNHWAAGSSSAPAGVRPPPNSDPKNAEVKKAAPTGSTGAVTSSSLPAPAYQSAWVNANPGKRTMAEIVKMGKPLHQKKIFVPPRSSETLESGSKAPLKDEGSSVEKKDVSEPVSAVPKTHADYQVSEPQHVDDESRSSETKESGSKAPSKDEGSSVEKQDDVSAPVSSLLKPAAQQVDEPQMDDEVLEMKTNSVSSHPDVDLAVQCSQLRFGTFGSKTGSGQATSGFNHNLENTQETTREKDSSFRNLENNLYGEGEEEQQVRDNVPDGETYYHIDLTARNDSEREAAQHEPPQEDPQMQNNIECFVTNVMHLTGAGQQAAPLNQQPDLNAHYRQHGMPLRHHGNFTCYPYVPHGNYMHPSFQQQNENSLLWQQLNRPYLRAAPGGGVYIFNALTSQPPPSFVQAQQLYQQQLSQQAVMWLNDHHQHQHHHYHHQHHHYHHQQSGGEASSWTRGQLWPNNN